MDAYETIDVAAPPAVTVEALREQLRANGITEYAVVDHGRDMAAAGVTRHPAWTLVFGNPRAGEALLARDLRAAVDIPLRLAVVADGPDGSAIVVRPMRTLLGEANADLADRFTELLRTLAADARDAATRPR
jgi:uncharacterized protein (DUF302 family)